MGYFPIWRCCWQQHANINNSINMTSIEYSRLVYDDRDRDAECHSIDIFSMF